MRHIALGESNGEIHALAGRHTGWDIASQLDLHRLGPGDGSVRLGEAGEGDLCQAGLPDGKCGHESGGQSHLPQRQPKRAAVDGLGEMGDAEHVGGLANHLLLHGRTKGVALFFAEKQEGTAQAVLERGIQRLDTGG